MSKSITVQATNKINLVGKLLDATFGSGKTTDGRVYKRASITVRANQLCNGHMETTEVPVSLFATEYTSTGKANPAWKSITELEELNTAQNVGIDAAATVQVTRGILQENNFVSRSGQLINGWQLRGSFVNPVREISDIATFTTEIFIMDMHDEVDREGETTGRLIIKGGIVQYGGRLDVVEFVVESPDHVEYIQRNWEINATVQVKGRIRVTSVEDKPAPVAHGWGEDIPENDTRFVRELVITAGDDTPKDEEFAYDPTEIKKAFNERKAMLEQLQMDARARSAKGGAGSANATATTTNKYSWE